MKREFGFSVLVLFLLTVSCATTNQNKEGVASVSRGISIMVDASTMNQSTIGADDFPVANNKAVAELAAGTAKAVLESKGMTVAGTPQTSIGARTIPYEKSKSAFRASSGSYNLINPDGTKTETSEIVQPPFAATPELDENGRKQLNELYHKLVRQYAVDPSSSFVFYHRPPAPPTVIDPALLANVQGDGVLIVICEGRSPSAGSRAAAAGSALIVVVAAVGNKDAKFEGEFRTQSRAEIYLIKRSTGTVLWHDEAEGHDLTPTFFAETVKKMLEKLPKADN